MFGKALALSAIAISTCEAQNLPPFTNAEDPTKYTLVPAIDGGRSLITPTFNAQLIWPNAPYNTDQNSMKIEYWSEYDAELDELFFHVKLISKIEINTVGSNVYQWLGFFDNKFAKWDYLKCTVSYDGDANANSDPPSRLYTATDHSSLEKP